MFNNDKEKVIEIQKFIYKKFYHYYSKHTTQFLLVQVIYFMLAFSILGIL